MPPLGHWPSYREKERARQKERGWGKTRVEAEKQKRSGEGRKRSDSHDADRSETAGRSKSEIRFEMNFETLSKLISQKVAILPDLHVQFSPFSSVSMSLNLAFIRV